MTDRPDPAPLTIHSERTLRGAVAADVRVKPGGVLWLRGTVDGDVWIEPGGRVHVIGVLNGDAHVEGRLVIRGTLNGRVKQTRTASVVRRE